MRKILIIMLVVMTIIAVIVGIYYFSVKSKKPKVIHSFEDCTASDQLVVNTIPRECHTKDGKVYIEEDNHVSLADYIVVTVPEPYSVITSFTAEGNATFKVEGKARSLWFANNRITVRLLDSEQKELASKPAYALADTSTDTMVPFVVAISFKIPDCPEGKWECEKGKLFIEKASSKDFPGKNGPLIIPIRFK